MIQSKKIIRSFWLSCSLASALFVLMGLSRIVPAALASPLSVDTSMATDSEAAQSATSLLAVLASPII